MASPNSKGNGDSEQLKPNSKDDEFKQLKSNIKQKKFFMIIYWNHSKQIMNIIKRIKKIINENKCFSILSGFLLNQFWL